MIDLTEEIVVIQMARALAPLAHRLPNVPPLFRIHAYCQAGVPDLPMVSWRALDHRAQTYAMIKAKLDQHACSDGEGPLVAYAENPANEGWP